MRLLPPSSTLFPYTTLFRSHQPPRRDAPRRRVAGLRPGDRLPRSEEHTSELQSRGHLVCRLLLEKKKNMADLTRAYPEAGQLVQHAAFLAIMGPSGRHTSTG